MFTLCACADIHAFLTVSTSRTFGVTITSIETRLTITLESVSSHYACALVGARVRIATGHVASLPMETRIALTLGVMSYRVLPALHVGNAAYTVSSAVLLTRFGNNFRTESTSEVVSIELHSNTW